MASRRSRRGFRRQVARKFVWDRTSGTVVGAADGTGTIGVDLLSAFRDQPGATHLGATVTRIRGFIYPESAGDVPAFFAGVAGFRIDSWNESAVDLTNQPFAMPDEDWLGWLPYSIDTSAGPQQSYANWNEGGGWAVDIKAQRKLEELNQTLWMFVTVPPTGVVNYNYILSVGLKLA